MADEPNVIVIRTKPDEVNMDLAGGPRGPVGPAGPKGPPAFTLSATAPASPVEGHVWVLLP